MKALLIRPYNQIEVINIDNKLEVYQDLVQGYIEPIYEDEYILLVNDEGLLRNFPQNVLNLVGNIVIVRNGGEDFEPLTDDDIQYWVNRLQNEALSDEEVS